MTKNYNSQLQKKIRNLTSYINQSAHDFTTWNKGYLEKVEYPKNTILIKEGVICDTIFFLIKGAARSFTYDSKLNEITTWLAFENEPIFSPISYTLQEPSYEIVHTLENTVAWTIKYSVLKELYKHDLYTNQMGRILMENTMGCMMLRAQSLQCQFAEERYENLLNQHPDILQRVPLKYLASYLGIKIETLSRIRKNFKQRQRVK